MEEYKKSYKGLVIWLILYMAAFFVPVFLPAEVKLITLLCYNIMIIGCAVLTYMIYKNEKIFFVKKGNTYLSTTKIIYSEDIAIYFNA